MADRVELAIRRHARALIPAGRAVLIAVSGGGDSIALLQVLARQARSRSWTLTVAHLDHGMRDDSAADRAFVETAAGALGLPVVADRRSVARLRRRDESPEEAARRVRRAFLLESATALGCEAVALGHTLDDQAETILMRLIRGAGPRALAGMAAQGPGPLVRPLLQLERTALRTMLQRRGWEYRDDPTNAEQRFDRNRLRQRLVPLLDELNPKASQHIVQAARQLREDALLLDSQAEQAAEALFDRLRDGSLAASGAAVASLPGPLARRVAQIGLRQVGGDLRRLSRRHLETVLDLAAGARGRQADLPGRITGWKDGRGRLRLRGTD